jgi:hypothetical protein
VIAPKANAEWAAMPCQVEQYNLGMPLRGGTLVGVELQLGLCLLWAMLTAACSCRSPPCPNSEMGPRQKPEQPRKPKPQGCGKTQA